MGPWIDPIPYLLCSARLASWPRKLQSDLWRSKRINPVVQFLLGFLFQTAVGRMLEELAANNSYHLLEAVGEKEQLFTKSVRFKKLLRFLYSIIIWSRWRLSWLWCKTQYEHNQNNTYNSHFLRCLIFEFRKTGLSCSDWSTDRHRSKMRFEFLCLYHDAWKRRTVPS